MLLKSFFYKTSLIATACFVVLYYSLGVINKDASAAPVVGFNAGNIIDDFVFTNPTTMSANDIQSFLNSKVPVCDTNGTQISEYGGGTRAQWGAANYNQSTFVCLKDYSENGKSSAQIIYDASQQYQINPQVLIVLLQKEQALVTDTWPLNLQYRSATGYGCPDTSACDSQYYGLTNQINWSAKMFRAIMNASPTWYTPYVLGSNYVRWSPNSACGGTIINIENRATQALYNYTPYQPNAAALNAGFGTGDSCSAYGNRNFYLYFTSWFGSVRANDTYQPHPDGTLVSFDGSAYLVTNGALQHITNGTYFEANGYRWQDIKPATTGDKALPKSSDINYIRPGIFYRSPTSGVYQSVYESGQWVKQLVTYDSFTQLADKWSTVLVVPDNTLPTGNSTTNYTSLRHPDGALISDGSNVYALDNGARRYVSPSVFNSYRWDWNNVQKATSSDSSLPLGSAMTLKEGAVVGNSGNIFIVDITSNAVSVRPIGPWECYSNAYKYNTAEVITLQNSELPPIGSRVSC